MSNSNTRLRANNSGLASNPQKRPQHNTSAGVISSGKGGISDAGKVSSVSEINGKVQSKPGTATTVKITSREEQLRAESQNAAAYQSQN